MTCHHALYSINDIRQVEQAAMAELPSFTLMQRAGLAATDIARTLLADTPRHLPVLILAGPGNNGGDACEVATHLANDGWQVTLMTDADTDRLPSDAAQAFAHAQQHASIKTHRLDPDAISATSWAIVVDGLFGIGLTRAIDGTTADVVRAVNTLRCPILAIDVPSGLHVETGNVIGGHAGVAIHATHTVTFIGDKPGLHTGNGRDYAGEVHIASLAIEAKYFPASSMHLNDVSLFSDMLQPRRQNSHKGSFGDVIVLGGSRGMIGAALLSASAAAKSGAGRVFIASPDDAIDYDSTHPEIMCRPAQTIAFDRATIVAGPGLGTSRVAHNLVNKAIASDAPLVLDADALNLIAEEPSLQQKLKTRSGATIVTPHPLEAARLLGKTTHDVQRDRIAAARALAEQLHAIVILKGSGTIIAARDHNQATAINPTGNPALATAGAGDVLAGLCGTLLAQHWPAFEAASGAVWLHGKSADDLVAAGFGPIGVTASELIPAIRSALNRLIAQHASARSKN